VCDRGHPTVNALALSSGGGGRPASGPFSHQVPAGAGAAGAAAAVALFRSSKQLFVSPSAPSFVSGALVVAGGGGGSGGRMPWLKSPRMHPGVGGGTGGGLLVAAMREAPEGTSAQVGKSWGLGVVLGLRLWPLQAALVHPSTTPPTAHCPHCQALGDPGPLASLLAGLPPGLFAMPRAQALMPTRRSTQHAQARAAAAAASGALDALAASGGGGSTRSGTGGSSPPHPHPKQRAVFMPVEQALREAFVDCRLAREWHTYGARALGVRVFACVVEHLRARTHGLPH
jgi:hypothetical protein